MAKKSVTRLAVTADVERGLLTVSFWREGRKIGRAYLLNTPARCERVMSLFKNPMIGISPWGLCIALALEG
jgi:hypothetical protein